MTTTKETILTRLKTALEPLDYINALWEGGAAAWGRADQWSDIDLQMDVDDDRVEDSITAFENALLSISPIDLRYDIPMPTWHGHNQVIFRLKNTSPYLLIDLAVMKHSSTDKFMEPELHGSLIVHFDKRGVIDQKPLNRSELQKTLASRIETLKTLFDMFQVLTEKEINRGNAVEAIAYYQGFTLRPLVEALRIKYKPEQYDYHTRYIYYDLPGDVLKKLESFYFVKDLEELRNRRREAEELFWETIASLESR